MSIKYALVLDKSYVRDVQIDVNHNKEMEDFCNNGDFEEDDERVVDYENREWHDHDVDVVIEEFEISESCKKTLAEIVKEIIEENELKPYMVRLIKIEEVSLDGI